MTQDGNIQKTLYEGIFNKPWPEIDADIKKKLYDVFNKPLEKIGNLEERFFAKREKIIRCYGSMLLETSEDGLSDEIYQSLSRFTLTTPEKFKEEATKKAPNIKSDFISEIAKTLELIQRDVAIEEKKYLEDKKTAMRESNLYLLHCEGIDPQKYVTILKYLMPTFLYYIFIDFKDMIKCDSFDNRFFEELDLDEYTMAIKEYLLRITSPVLNFLKEKYPDGFQEVQNFINDSLKNKQQTFLEGALFAKELRSIVNNKPYSGQMYLKEVFKEVKRFIIGITPLEDELFTAKKSASKNASSKIIEGHANLNPYDREVYNAVVSLWYVKNERITPQMIFNVLSGIGHMKQESKMDSTQRIKIMESLQRMCATEILISGISKPLLSYESCDGPFQGQKDGDYNFIIHLLQAPLLFTYAKKKNQWGSVPLSMVNIEINNVNLKKDGAEDVIGIIQNAHITSNTQENITIKGYLFRRMLRAKYFEDSSKLKISYSNMRKDLGLKNKKTMIGKIRGFLEFWKLIGAISERKNSENTIRNSTNNDITMLFDSESIKRCE